MDANPFFRWLGRINAIGLFLIGVLVLLFIVWDRLPFGDTQRLRGIAHTTGAETFDLNASLDQAADAGPLRLAGTNEALLVLRSEGVSSREFSSEERTSRAVNIMLLNLDTMRSHYLFGGVDRAIGSVTYVHAANPAPTDGSDRVVGILMEIAERDTNNDGQITSADEQTLFVYRPSAARAIPLMRAKSIIGMQQLDAGHVLIAYRDDRSERFALFSSPAFERLADGPVPPIPQ